ncbi:hypothetical protein JL09_g6607 [Pichia kudriavzevii]|uniref:Uncharacterized protein n=1 Tax=Pichia kudriavzevii TaxID=4909 RepID=A0A099NMV5_PICKU|nr:hypothetical protein JL09_g6607 [Pichia kudriavzevii]
MQYIGEENVERRSFEVQIAEISGEEVQQ